MVLSPSWGTFPPTGAVFYSKVDETNATMMRRDSDTVTNDAEPEDPAHGLDQQELDIEVTLSILPVKSGAWIAG